MPPEAPGSQTNDRHVENQKSLSGVAGYIKLFGGFILGLGSLITVMVGVLEYIDHNEQERMTSVFNSMALIENGSGTTVLRENILKLITPFYYKGYDGDIVSDLKNKPDHVKHFIESNLFHEHMQEFKNILSFLGTMHQYGLTGACPWMVISVSYSRDASTVLYYFAPVLYDKEFAKEQNTDAKFLEDLAYQTPPTRFKIPCETQPLLQKIKNAIN